MRRAVLTTLMLAAPRAALACPVCFGQNDSPLAAAVNAGIIAMLIVTGGVLAAFASFFIYLMRRARLARSAESLALQVQPPSRGDGHAQEGTAPC